jgi:predicted transcriptional regulator
MNKPRLLINGKKISRINLGRLIIIEELAKGRPITIEAVKKKGRFHQSTARKSVYALIEANVLHCVKTRDGGIKHSGSHGCKVYATKTLARNLKLKLA